MNSIIENFVSNKNVALIGVSSDKQKFGNFLLIELAKRGYTVFPVHPTLTEINGTKCYPGVESLPDNVNNLILAVKPEITEQIIPLLKNSYIRRVWIHRGSGKGSSSEAAISACKNSGIEVVYGFCPMMFLAPSGIHNFHFWLRKKFGKVPEEYNI